jgi:serine/threonine protein kinase
VEFPQQFGDYTLLERIATGGMAEVFRARAEGLAGFEKIVVIKRVLDSLANDPEFIDLFVDEAKIAVRLLHVNIVQVFELGRAEDHHYMALEFVAGLDVARLVAKSHPRGPFPVPLALFITCEVLKALDFAHSRCDDEGQPLHIVHCDISPQNMLISFAGEVKITDFGISRAAFQASNVHDVIRGKYAYMSPEQVEGKGLDGRSDLFSLGIVLYELLTGRRLFKRENREETIRRVRHAEVPSPRAYRPEVSEDLEALLLKALARRASDRFQTAGAMLEAVGQLMVREGHRATNNDLSSFIRRITATHDEQTPRQPEVASTAIVALAVEAFPPPRSLSTPKTSLARLSQEWAGLIADAGGQVWEQAAGGVLVVWVGGELKDRLAAAVDLAVALKRITKKTGYRLAAGVAPGVARVHSSSNRPGEGWELAGPFYLARWMMNLSAHRGRLLLTEVGARHVEGRHSTQLLGRISILGDRFINLFELS